ncbi:hypothetical protein KGY77_08615 [Candidatus Bipolaricaulota bacterium]|nr:hypothetical protein [Candidatus Bipolaricaulota bacterium]
MSVQNKSNCLVVLYGFIALFMLGSLIMVGAPSALAQTEDPILTGDWSNSLFLYSGDGVDDTLDFSSSISLTYSFSGVDLTSVSRFSDKNSNGGNGYAYKTQNFGLDTRIGILGLSSDVVFAPEAQRLDYWLSTATTSFAGFTVTENFLVEFQEYPTDLGPGPGYGAGSEIVLNGKTSQGLEVEFSSRFGMEESLLEQEGVEDGSGYDIVIWGADGPFTYSPSNLQYVSSTLKVANSSLGCCEFDSTTWFSREKGFEDAEFEFYMNSENLPVSIGTSLKFAPDEKTVLLDPQLDVEGNCFTLYLDFAEKDTPSTYDLELKGFGLQGVEVGDAITLSSITSLKGNLYRFAGTNDISLRASSYTIDPLTPAYYVGPLNFDQVFSIAASLNDLTNLGLDIYFNMSESDQLFDLQKFTGDATYHVGSQFQLGTGVEITPGSDQMMFILEADYSF